MSSCLSSSLKQEAQALLVCIRPYLVHHEAAGLSPRGSAVPTHNVSAEALYTRQNAVPASSPRESMHGTLDFSLKISNKMESLDTCTCLIFVPSLVNACECVFCCSDDGND